MPKIVYQTDANGYFVGPVEADPSPLEPGVWLIPGGAVEQEPPFFGEGQAARWKIGAWTVETIPLPMPEPEPEPEPRLSPLSARQFRLGLHANGLLASVQSSIDALEEPERTAAQIEWEYATEIERQHPLVVNLASQLSLSEEQINTMWIAAAAL